MDYHDDEEIDGDNIESEHSTRENLSCKDDPLSPFGHAHYG